MSIPENDTQLWKGFDGHGLYAKRTERDREGVIIDEAYARKSELHQLENALSDSTTTELTPAAAKSAIDALRKAPTPGNEGTMLSYGVSQNAMAWDSWEDEQMDIPVAGAVIGGRVYRTVKIGNQTWLAENLDYKFPGLTVGKDGLSYDEPGAHYYDNEESTYGVNGNKYGLLYNWDAAKYLEDNKAKLIPGWHVPTRAEWNTLVNFVGNNAGNELRSKTGWAQNRNGTDDYEMTIYPAGNKGAPGFSNLTVVTYLWTPERADFSSGYCVSFYNSPTMFTTSSSTYTEMSIRLVKDS